MKQKIKPGIMLLFYGWMGMFFFSVVGIFLNDITKEDYGDLGNILPWLSNAPDLVMIRPWMVQYNTVISICNLSVLVLMFLGSVKYSRGDRRSKFGTLAAFGFAAAILGVAAMLLYPVTVGSGPWLMDSVELRGVWVLVFLPLVLRTGAFAFLVMLFAFNLKDRKSLARLGFPVVLVLVLIDLALMVWKWMATDVTVFAVFHPCSRNLLALVPSVISSFLFLVLLWLEREEVKQP